MTEQVADLTSRRLEALVGREQVSGRLPSLMASVVRDGELVWRGGHGEQTGAAPPSPDTQYRIGSITKIMTAVLVMQLRDEGLLDLNDPLERHLPGVGYGERTLRSLLSHSSGMWSEPPGPWWERSPGVSLDQLVTSFDGSGYAHAPGATFHYSNLAFALLGALVARRRGKSWWEQVRERILRPLGMERTSYLPEEPAAIGYSVDHFAGTLTQEPAHDAGAMAPAGQLWSTVEDLATYAAFLLSGSDEVLPLSTLQEMTTPAAGTLTGGLSGAYGLGLRLVAGGSGMLVGHTGSMPGFLAGLFVDRERHVAGVVLANGTTGLRCEGLPLDLLAALEEAEPTVPRPWSANVAVPATVSEVLGVWYWGNTAYAFSWTGQEVEARGLASGNQVNRFRPTEGGRLVGTSGYHHGETLEVARTPDGAVSHLTCATFVYTRTPYDPAAPIPGGPPPVH